MFNKRILITGGTGSWGKELIRQLLQLEPKSVTIYSRNEFMSVSTIRYYNDNRLKAIIGDVRDYEALNKACKDIDIVLHLAALKHIPICEDYPHEAIKTNIIGTENVIKAAINNEVEKVVDISTDKAANPLNLYGMTKAIGEKLILLANSANKTNFVCLRAGNVLGSNGSVVPLFIKQLKDYNEITVTDPNMTRYFLTLEEAIQLVLTAANFNQVGGLFVMKMPSCNLQSLADVIIEKYGDSESKIKIIGVRQGEKTHEMLITEWEALNAYKYTDNYYLIHNESQNLEKVEFEYYSSNSQPLMTKEAIKDLLIRGGFYR